MVIKLKNFGLDIPKASLTPGEKAELDKTLPELREREILDVLETDKAYQVKGKQKDLYRLLLAITYNFDVELL